MTRERERGRKKKRIMISNNNLFTLFKDKISSGGTNHSLKTLKILNQNAACFLNKVVTTSYISFCTANTRGNTITRPNFRQMHQD